MTITVAALYRFVSIEDPAIVRAPLASVCEVNGIRGTLLLAQEGINGTVAGTDHNISETLDWIREHVPGCADLDVKLSYTDSNPFLRMKVRLKKEIVTMGVPDIDPNRAVGTYVPPADWNSLISDPEVLVIDTRNDYEVGIGTFKGAINPGTETFRQFPKWVKDNLEIDSDASRTRKVAMFCTGGIRCEKSTAYLKDLGFDEVYHLQGGILKYLETIPPDESMWEGECFVFDQRVAVGQGLELGTYDQCYACRYPITQDDKKSPHYKPGVSCPRCHDLTDTQQKVRFAERQKQIDLARKSGAQHLGHCETSSRNTKQDRPSRTRSRN